MWQELEEKGCGILHRKAYHPKIPHVNQVGHKEWQQSTNNREYQHVNPSRGKLFQIRCRQHQPSNALLFLLLTTIECACGDEEKDIHGYPTKRSHRLTYGIDYQILWLERVESNIPCKPEEEQIEQEHTECAPHHGLEAFCKVEFQHATKTCHIKVFHFTSPFVTALNNSSRFTCVSGISVVRRTIAILP